MLRLLEVADLCSSNISDPANRFRKTRKKKSSAVLLFRSGRRSPICVRLSTKGKVGVQRGRETAGVPSFLPPPRARQSPALRRAQLPRRGAAKNSPPGKGEHAHAVRVPRTTGAEKEPPVRGEPACGGSCAPSIPYGKRKKITETICLGDFILPFIRGRSE